MAAALRLALVQNPLRTTLCEFRVDDTSADGGGVDKIGRLLVLSVPAVGHALEALDLGSGFVNTVVSSVVQLVVGVLSGLVVLALVQGVQRLRPSRHHGRTL